MENFEHLINLLPIPPKTKKAIWALKLVKSLWTKILDQELVLCSNPVRYEEGTLIVEVPDYYRLQILQLKSKDLLQELEKNVPEEYKPMFLDLKLVINPKLLEGLSRKTKSINKYKKDILDKQLKSLENILKNIGDPELAKLFKGLLKRHFEVKIQNSAE
ncbi:DUF721 domain-containing protein [Thermodesulfobacterium sp. TA1]|uniref:DciA family protein n=1 Tax=Thermodesulfobacterium sp. TA1 TaxID=2234087 RepID=UPI001231A480|nr:DciA family protein [Thermodesulfobacterium sp. TA1]QER42443.1 DUF721 domain-containing protein [Thermodesulfobacterium sp. TA1]